MAASHDYGFYLSRAMQAAGSPASLAGASGYFEAPQATLDPRLFDGDQLRPAVTSFILNTLYDFWGAKYNSPRKWSRVWIAGSGITYQWAGDRGNGDLDVLIGVGFDRFYGANPDWRGIPESDMASIFNKEFREELWPRTANWNGFEVTFYVNPGAEDIRNINPYAAYDVTSGRWTVRPPVVPAEPESAFPDEYWKAVSAEEEQARSLIDRYDKFRGQAEAMPANSPGWNNAVSAQRLVVDQARTLYDSIHLGRRQAFSPGGSGYGDYYNFRWQAHKRNGTVARLHALVGVGSQAREEAEQALYGLPLKSASDVLTEAALWHRRPA